MNEVQYLQSKLLAQTGIKHGWCMRYGGVSKGLFESLNGKKGVGDPDSNIDENRQRAVARLCHPSIESRAGSELDSRSSCSKNSCLLKSDTLAHIIHEFKTNILVVKTSGEFDGYDASITTNSEVVLSQTTADCGTVIIASKDGQEVALIHGSWHTLKDKIICNVVAKMNNDTQALVAGIGPMICQKCYEFGPEAATLFADKYRTPTGKKYRVNLKQMILDQLAQAGVMQVDDMNICTKEDERFFSHRRSGANSGRFLTLASTK